MYLLLISQILGVFANTLTADDMYSLHNREKLTRPIPMQLSKELKLFDNFYTAYLKSR